MPKGNNKVNKFSLFIRDYQARIRREEGRYISFEDARVPASSLWEALSDEERQTYKDRATNFRQNGVFPASNANRSEKSRVFVETPKGKPVKVKPELYPKRDFRVVLSSADAYESDRKSDCISLVSSLQWCYNDKDLSAFYAALGKQSFYFASCEHVGFQEREQLYPAVELALVELTLNDGILQRKNFYIIPPKDSIENVQKAKIDSFRTNKLFLKPKRAILDQFKMIFYDCNSNSTSLWREIYELIVGGNESDPGAVFCLASEYHSVHSALWQIKSDALQEKKLPVHFFKDTGPKSVKCVEDLLQAILKYVDERDPPAARVSPKAAVDSHSFEAYFNDTSRGLLLTEKCPCEFHSAIASPHCALAKATAASWSFLKMLRDKNITRAALVPGKHLPVSNRQVVALSPPILDAETVAATDLDSNYSTASDHTLTSRTATRPKAAAAPAFGLSSASSAFTFYDDEAAEAEQPRANPALAPATSSGFGAGASFFSNVTASADEANFIPDVPLGPAAFASGFSGPIRQAQPAAGISAQAVWGTLPEQFSHQISGIGQPEAASRRVSVDSWTPTQAAIAGNVTGFSVRQHEPFVDTWSPSATNNAASASGYQNIAQQGQFGAFDSSAAYATAMNDVGDNSFPDPVMTFGFDAAASNASVISAVSRKPNSKPASRSTAPTPAPQVPRRPRIGLSAAAAGSKFSAASGAALPKVVSENSAVGGVVSPSGSIVANGETAGGRAISPNASGISFMSNGSPSQRLPKTRGKDERSSHVEDIMNKAQAILRGGNSAALTQQPSASVHPSEGRANVTGAESAKSTYAAASQTKGFDPFADEMPQHSLVAPEIESSLPRYPPMPKAWLNFVGESLGGSTLPPRAPYSGDISQSFGGAPGNFAGARASNQATFQAILNRAGQMNTLN